MSKDADEVHGLSKLHDDEPPIFASLEMIPLHKAVARITPDSIAVKQSRAGLVGPLVALAITTVSVWVMTVFISVVPLALLVLLLFVTIVFGPLGIIGLVNNVAGTSFIMEREKQSARWQQGLLGLGIGTYELVPFWDIDHFEVITDYDDVLSSGIEQDVVHWEVVLVKANARELAVGSVVAARLLALDAGRRANELAVALGEMSGGSVELADLEGIDDPEGPLMESDE